MIPLAPRQRIAFIYRDSNPQALLPPKGSEAAGFLDQCVCRSATDTRFHVSQVDDYLRVEGGNRTHMYMCFADTPLALGVPQHGWRYDDASYEAIVVLVHVLFVYDELGIVSGVWTLWEPHPVDLSFDQLPKLLACHPKHKLTYGTPCRIRTYDLYVRSVVHFRCAKEV